eukprot:14852454-Alexandrium_andersonii.AAC.1
MSASLVGSEMCIRDSDLPRRGPNLDSEMVSRDPPARHLDLHGVGQDFAPVSYTHLTLPTICSV